jgi:crotonobetainyl-CoA:carnitine CoA-transferase CaiB-like acyl-CoA transferase
MPLLARADVVVEQFRPGVMDRLGLGYARLSELNPGLVYCAITGYGQDGPKAQQAGHDLDYMAETGVLGLAVGADGAPIVPPVLAADIAGGAYPAVMNILLALRGREASGVGAFLDIAMTDNLFPFAFWAQALVEAGGRAPLPSGELLSGGSPRYRIYPTSDGRFLAVAPIEQKFWENFCRLIELPAELRDDRRDSAATIAGVAARIATRSSQEWEQHFAGEDVCCSIVRTQAEAWADPHFRARGLFDRQVRGVDGSVRTALPVPVVPALRVAGKLRHTPALGADDTLLS